MRRRAVPVFRPRRRRNRLVVVAFIVLGLLVIGAGVLVGGGYWYLSRSLPAREGTIHLTGLNGEVRVYWDERSIPHIEAANAEDLFFAQGFVTAQDRLWQMDLFRRLAGGRMAEILGESELYQDMFFRALGFRQAAEASLAEAEPEALAMAEAYAAGVSAYIEQVMDGGLLPIEFRLLGYEPEPWTPVDTLLIARLMAYTLSANWDYELNRYLIAESRGWDILHEWLPEYPSVAPTITTWASMQPTEPDVPIAPLIPGDGSPSTDAMGPTSATNGASGAADSASDAQDATDATDTPDATDVPDELDAFDTFGTFDALDTFEALDDTHRTDEPPQDISGDSARTAWLTELQSLVRFAPPPHMGSNSWALAPDKTVTGGALLANDPHLQFGIPSIWHQVHLVLEGDFQAIGVTVPGVPGVVFGRNDRIAWAITSLEADSQDLFIQRPNPDNPREFLYKNDWEPARVREEVIYVKGQTDPVIYEVLETARHGPVLNPTLGPAVADVLSLRWTALGPTREINALLPLMRARNFDDFEAAVDTFDMPALSFLYADVDGNIGYKASGLLPMRPGDGGRVPLPAWTGEHDWIGTIPKAEMPRSYNPPSGFIVTANNLPVDADYPYYMSDRFNPWRALRITTVLEQGENFTIDDMRALQMDTTNVHAEQVLPTLIAAVEARVKSAAQLDDVENAALALLKEWDFVEHHDAGAPYIWHTWREELERYAVQERLGFPVDEVLLLDHVLMTMRPAELEEVATRAFRAAVRRGVTAQGNDPNRWQWGRWHRLTVYHPVGENISALGWLVNVGDWPLGGSEATPLAAGFLRESGEVVHGASWRTVVDLRTGAAQDVLLPGNSGHILSPAYKDQADAWYAGQLYEQQWRPEQYRRGALLRLLPQ